MQKNTFFQASLIGFAALVAACSSSSSAGTAPASSGDSGTSTSTAASITISAPTDNGTLTLSATKTADITFAVTGFTLMAPGSCPSDDNDTPPCGHVHVLIDGNACNDTASGSPYNVAANASPATANFGLCTTADGPHTIVLELHNNDHSPYQVNSQTVSATVHVTTSG